MENKFEVGDYVEITEDNGGDVKPGRIGIITDEEDYMYNIMFPDDPKELPVDWYLYKNNAKLIWRPGGETQFKVGDKVTSEVYVGVGKVVRLCHLQHCFVAQFPGENEHHFDAGELTLAPEEKKPARIVYKRVRVIKGRYYSVFAGVKSKCDGTTLEYRLGEWTYDPAGGQGIYTHTSKEEAIRLAKVKQDQWDTREDSAVLEVEAQGERDGYSYTTLFSAVKPLRVVWSSCPAVEIAVVCPFKPGDKVRVPKSVSKPVNGWGAVTWDSVGVVNRIAKSTSLPLEIYVIFPKQSYWSTTPECLELVPEEPPEIYEDVTDQYKFDFDREEGHWHLTSLTGWRHCSIGIEGAFYPINLPEGDFFATGEDMQGALNPIYIIRKVS